MLIKIPQNGNAFIDFKETDILFIYIFILNEVRTITGDWIGTIEVLRINLYMKLHINKIYIRTTITELKAGIIIRCCFKVLYSFWIFNSVDQVIGVRTEGGVSKPKLQEMHSNYMSFDCSMASENPHFFRTLLKDFNKIWGRLVKW